MKRIQLIALNHDNENSGITEILSELQRKDYKLKFRREATCLYCFDLQQWSIPDDFTVDESVYIEEISNPDADRILYAILLSQGGKGFLIDACNVYADNISPEMAHKLNLNITLNAGGTFYNAGIIEKQD